MRPPDDPLVLPATGAEVRLDLDAQTLTFHYRGRSLLKSKREASPVVVPLGAIESVACKNGRVAGWFQVIRRDRAGWHKDRTSDLHSVSVAVDPTEFAKRVEAAVALAEPIEATPPPTQPGTNGPQPRALLPTDLFADSTVDPPRRNDDGPGFFRSLFGN